MPSLYPMSTTPRLAVFILCACLLLGLHATPARAGEEAAQLDREVDAALQSFVAQVPGAPGFLKAAKGVLVFPKVYQAGLVLGAQHGRGALRVAGRTRDYYSLFSASVGLQLGARVKSIVVVFLQDEGLQGFIGDPGMRLDLDALGTFTDRGQGTGLDNLTLRGPVVGFVLGQQGMMYQFSLEGAQLHKIEL